MQSKNYLQVPKQKTWGIQKYLDNERQFISVLSSEEPPEELKIFGQTLSNIYNMSLERQKDILKNIEKREKEIHYNSFIQNCIIECDKNNVTPAQMYCTYKKWYHQNFFDSKFATLSIFKHELSSIWRKPVNNMWINVKTL